MAGPAGVPVGAATAALAAVFLPDVSSLTEWDVQQVLAAAERRAGIGLRVTLHTLRYPFVTRFLGSGGDLATLQAILGHANLSMTVRYLHLDAGRMQGMVEEL